MAKLVRFHDWLINVDDISGSDISEEDNKGGCILKITMKAGHDYSLTCYSQERAQQELDKLTCDSEAMYCGNKWDHFLVKRIQVMSANIYNLEVQVKKLMNSFATAKKKLSKSEK